MTAATYTAQFPGTASIRVYRVVPIHRAWMEVGAAHHKGHEACECCDYLQLTMDMGDIDSIDTYCTLNQSGGSPEQCGAINPRYEAAE